MLLPLIHYGVLYKISIEFTEMKSYTIVRREREEFRKKLVSLILTNEDPTEEAFPNADEREVLKYYYYIKYGIDTIHVAPIDSKLVTKIMKLLPKTIGKYQDVIVNNMDEVKSEYLLAVKKAVVDFVLGDSLNRKKMTEKFDTPERIDLKAISLKYKHKYVLYPTYLNNESIYSYFNS